MARMVESLKEVKACRAGDRVSLRARILRLWEVGGKRMCLVGDASAVIRIELGEAEAEPGRSYQFRDALVQRYSGGWQSLSLDEKSALEPLTEAVPVSADDAYIDYVYKILSGVQRKKARKEGRLPSWRHPAAREPRT